ncbi:MAG: PIN domain-containing protein [Myxococcales bacterium]|nr:PIN domain-containing protein [Myxococcales bacterium]
MAVLDTSVIILLLSHQKSETAATKKRRECAELVVDDLVTRGTTLLVPTPVIAELCRDGAGSVQYELLVRALKRRVRTLALTVDAADKAGAMRRVALRKRPPDESRGAVSYDALIAGSAVAAGARWIVTANPRDYAALIRVTQANVEVICTDDPPKMGQLNLVHQRSLLEPSSLVESPAAAPDAKGSMLPK